MILHFAYGSNMSRAPMRRRCPGAMEVGAAILARHRFVIMSNGYASVVAAPGHDVHGALWRITSRDLAALNTYENVAGGLYRRAMLPVMQDASTVTALVYLGCERREGQARPGYMESVIEAAREWCLPRIYIAMLTRLSPGRWKGNGAPETGELH